MNPVITGKSSNNGGVQLCSEQNRSSVMLFSFLPVLLRGFHHNIQLFRVRGLSERAVIAVMGSRVSIPQQRKPLLAHGLQLCNVIEAEKL